MGIPWLAFNRLRQIYRNNDTLAKSKEYTLKVDTGLSILIKPSGNKLWRFRYSFLGKRCLISLGKYPQVSLKEAKAKHREYLDMLEKGINPSSYKYTQKAKLATEQNFKDVALEWHAKHYTNAKTIKASKLRLEKYLFPVIGKVPINDIEPFMLFNLIEAVQAKGFIETGKRLNTYCSLIFRYGVAKGYCSRDITQDYKGMLKNPKVKHMATLTSPEEIGEFLFDVNNYKGTIIAKTALLISAYVFVRPSELAQSEWSFIDFNKSEWSIPAHLMKKRRAHLIPFPRQVKILLRSLQPITGSSKYIFPSPNDDEKPMHSETVNKAIRKIENGKYIGRLVSHGFRGMASTILNENKQTASVTFGTDEIELQLAHVETNKVRGAYNHAEYLESRHAMMQWYANYLDDLRNNH